MFKYMLLPGCLLFLSTVVWSQCPDKDSLTNRLNFYVSDPSKVSTPQQLNELKQFEARLGTCGWLGDSTHALLLQRIGVLYYKQHDFVSAIKWIRLSINMTLSPRKKHDADPTLLIKNYYNLSLNYDSLHNATEQMASLDSCVETFRRLENDKKIDHYIGYILKVLEKRVESLYDIGDYNRCYDYASYGERVIRKHYHGKDSMNYSVNFLTSKVNTLITTQKYDEAELQLVHKAEDCKTAGMPELLGTVYDLLGQVQVNKNNPAAAKNYFLQSLAYDQKIGYAIGCMQTYTNLGYFLYYKYHHDNQLALACYKKGLDFFDHIKEQKVSDRVEALNLLTNIGQIYVQSKLYDSAFRYFQLALDQIRPGLQEGDLLNMSLESITKIEYLIGLLLDKAEAYYKLYKDRKEKTCFDHAISMYKITDKLLDKIKTEQSDVQSKLYWRRDNHRLYEQAIEACFTYGGKTDDAFYFFEKSRATLLNDQLTDQLLLKNQDRFKQAQLKIKIFQLQQRIRPADMALEEYNQVQNELLQYNEALNRMQENSKSGHETAYRKLFDFSSVTVENVQKTILQDHAALVELFEGDSAVYEIMITPRQAVFSKIAKADYDSTLHFYLTCISNYAQLNRSTQVYESAARHLYQLLFNGKPPPAGRIIVSPDGLYFPFETLITGNSKAPAYFLYRYAVSYTYSARYLLLLNKYSSQPGSGARTLLGMAPVSYKYDAALPDLLQSVQSVRNVQAYFSDADTMMFAAAAKPAFLQNFYHYKIIYLSTHASDSGSMGEPVIYFADGPMSLSELVAETRPQTELVIASACKTGLGKLNRGEGVYNFSRGFAAVGIPACVNNLWSVDESAANRLTELFCKYIAENEPTDVALKKAKIEFLQTANENQRLPYFWAASILSGKTSTIECKKPFRWKTALSLGVLAVFVIGSISVAVLRLR